MEKNKEEEEKRKNVRFKLSAKAGPKAQFRTKKKTLGTKEN